MSGKQKAWKPQALKPSQLYTICDPKQFDFKTTAELEDLDSVVGQKRAVEAIEFAIGMRRKGYNLFALGPTGTGKFSLLKRFVEKAAADDPVPDDWCYVNNFDEPHKPRALALPAGTARGFAQDMDTLVADLQQAIPAVFESEDYQTRKEKLAESFKERQEKAFSDLQKRANAEDITIVRTPMGLGLAPMEKGEVLSPEEFSKLSEKEQKKRKKRIEEFQHELEGMLRDVPRWEKEHREKLRELNQDVVRRVVDHQIDELEERHGDLPEVLDYLEQVQDSVIENLGDFIPNEAPQQGAPEGGAEGAFRAYRVNVVVDNCPMAEGEDCEEEHRAAKGAPVIYEDHPTMTNLLGRAEHLSHYGSLVTDFNLIKPGALHRANGGYLIIDARNLFMQPFAWDALKRALRAQAIRIENPGESYGLVSTITLEPEPIPLKAKIFLAGDPMLYYMLSRYDPEFKELFKVAADFDNRMDRTDDSALQYATLIGTLARKEELRPLDKKAVARVVEHGARLADDSEKLSTHMGSIVDLVREADYLAGKQNRKTVQAEDVQAAIDANVYRSDRIRERIHEEIQRGTLVIDTEGAKVGEVNGLAVYQLDHFAFGRPSRISCRVRIGKGEVVDIERQVDLGGPLHTKGVLILTSYLATKFALNKPLSLSATLVFEQSYSGVEGDSASSTELYALLSALSDFPIKQNLAVTGSVDQNGRVQAIGGVNEKIEGFFDVCRTRGLTGDQGVLIPEANVKHLMLRADVVEACRQGKFHVYPVETIDQGIEILTGVPAGAPDENGQFPIASINRAVGARLDAFTRKAHEFATVAPRRGRKRRDD